MGRWHRARWLDPRCAAASGWWDNPTCDPSERDGSRCWRGGPNVGSGDVMASASLGHFPVSVPRDPACSTRSATPPRGASASRARLEVDGRPALVSVCEWGRRPCGASKRCVYDAFRGGVPAARTLPRWQSWTRASPTSRTTLVASTCKVASWHHAFPESCD